MKIPLAEVPYRLYQDALDSLNEGLLKYREGIGGNKKAFKFAILHVSRFMELICKYIIAKIHPILIYENAFKEAPLSNIKTIRFEDAIRFIQNIYHKEISDSSNTFSKDVNFLKNIRNKISHHFTDIQEAEEASDILGGLIESICYVLYQYEEKDIITIGILPENKEIFDSIVDTYKAKIKLALKQAKLLNDGELIYFCPGCDNKTFILNEKKFKCTFCDYKESAHVCTLGWCCDEALIPESRAISWNDEYNDFVCEPCYEAFNDRVAGDKD